MDLLLPVAGSAGVFMAFELSPEGPEEAEQKKTTCHNVNDLKQHSEFQQKFMHHLYKEIYCNMTNSFQDPLLFNNNIMSSILTVQFPVDFD